MRIALNGFFWHMQTTGSGQYLRNLFHNLRALAPEHDYELLLPERTANDGNRKGIPGGCTLRTPFGSQRNLSKLWFEQISFPRACLRRNIDVAHVPYLAPPRKPTVPTVVTIHDLIPLILPEYRGSWLARGYTRLVSRAARRATIILTDSQASAGDIQRLLGIPGDRIEVVHLAADSAYRPLAEGEWRPVVRRLGVSPPYLLYLGGFDVRKNLCGLFGAFARVRRQVRVQLVIAGRLPAEHSAFRPDPRKLAHELGLDQGVHYTGWVPEEDKPALYAGALAFVFPSHYEGFGLPVLESIACGTPAIVGSGSSLEEIGGPGAISVASEDVPAIAEAILRLVQDAFLRERMGHAGTEHAHRFSWPKTAEQTLEAYTNALRLAQDAGGSSSRPGPNLSAEL